MTSSTSPLIGAALSVVVLFAGLFLRTSASSSSQLLGALFVGVAIIGLVANLAIFVMSRRR